MQCTDSVLPLLAPLLRFFVVEDHVLHTTQGLVNRAYVEELWELALSKTIAALRTHSVSFCLVLMSLPLLCCLANSTFLGLGWGRIRVAY